MSYGVVATLVKLTYADGYFWQQVSFIQGFFAMLYFGICCLAVLIRRGKLAHLSVRQIGSMVGLGITGCTTTLLYTFSLSLLPVAVSLTLLFQFAWMGLVVQVIADRRSPRTTEIVAALVIFAGTILGSGLYSSQLTSVDPIGLICALLSAMSVTAFMHFNGRVGTGVPWMQRGFFVCLGSASLAFVFCPDFFVSGALAQGIWLHGVPLGLFGLFLPVLLFGIGTPHLPTGISTIMASSELPCGIIFSTLILGDPIEPLQVIGVIAVLAGIVIAQLPNLKKRIEKPRPQP